MIANPTRCAECVLNDVARSFSVTPDQLRSRIKHRSIAFPRFAAYRMMRESGISYTVIGRVLGKRDHSSVVDGVRRAEELMRDDADFAMRYEAAR